MKQLTCEMCGGTDLIKQDGVFVCQSCGCKYSIEEAKKMMVEGTVEVAGTVKVDDSAKIENYLVLSQNAYNSGNGQSAFDYAKHIRTILSFIAISRSSLTSALLGIAIILLVMKQPSS